MSLIFFFFLEIFSFFFLEKTIIRHIIRKFDFSVRIKNIFGQKREFLKIEERKLEEKVNGKLKRKIFFSQN